jgi:hypothetical protein
MREVFCLRDGQSVKTSTCRSLHTVLLVSMSAINVFALGELVVTILRHSIAKF